MRRTLRARIARGRYVFVAGTRGQRLIDRGWAEHDVALDHLAIKIELERRLRGGCARTRGRANP